jgi:hypothetical protein
MNVCSRTQNRQRCEVEFIMTSFKIFKLLSRIFVEMYERNLVCRYPYRVSDTLKVLVTASQYCLYDHSLHALNEHKHSQRN